VVDFYVLFVDTLFDHFHQRHDVIAVSHAGHGAKAGGRIFSVQQQIDHKIQFLENTVKQNKEDTHRDTRFVLIGHSVGAYISIKVFKRRPDLGFINVVNLFHTIKHLWQGLTPVVKAFVQPGMRHVMSTFLHYAPASVTQSVLSYVSTLSDEARYITSNKIDYYLVMNVLYMAYTEGTDILEIDRECHDALTEHASKMYFLYGPTDQYTPKEFFDEIQQLYPDGNYEMAAVGVKHAFVLKNSEEVAEKVATFLASRLAAKLDRVEHAVPK